ncbi:MAG TPA: peptidoglycan editing factor PgeF [Candidatus Binatia bacterium]
MHDELRVPGWSGRIPHGFAPADQPVADGFHLVRAKQVHGTACVVADGRTPSPAGEADALLTTHPGVAVAIATADCVPLLLTADDGSAVAAVHAGWRGTLAGIAEVGVRALAERGVAPERVRAALGPSIDGCCFEIEREIAERFAQALGDETWAAWRDGPRAGKGTLDLRAINALVLRRAGVPQDAIARVGPCTMCGGGPFASYRRDGANAGRQLSWIGVARSGGGRAPAVKHATRSPGAAALGHEKSR